MRALHYIYGLSEGVFSREVPLTVLQNSFFVLLMSCMYVVYYYMYNYTACVCVCVCVHGIILLSPCVCLSVYALCVFVFSALVRNCSASSKCLRSLSNTCCYTANNPSLKLYNILLCLSVMPAIDNPMDN